MRNAGASISYGWLSRACVECTGPNGSETFSTTFRCHRDCYFCFNRNLPGYESYVREGCPWRQELKKASQRDEGLAVIGLTGGEPLVDLESSLDFLQTARSMFPQARLRMYTSGDLLTPSSAAALADAGLDEIRFSFKLDDDAELREKVLANLAMARESIADVVVEMPIIPGSGALMRDLMRRFADAGIRGMNLLEFCFPFSHWDEYRRRGFTLKNPPFDVMYDYAYSGGLAVSGSEELACELMLWGIGEKLPFGLHYCSLQNKHRSEMRQRNEPARGAGPLIAFDEGDFFLKSSCVFGPDRAEARTLLAMLGCRDTLEDDEEDSLSFPSRFAPLLADAGMDVMSRFFVAERDDEGACLVEVALKPFAG